jgi:hypothetical protein
VLGAAVRFGLRPPTCGREGHVPVRGVGPILTRVLSQMDITSNERQCPLPAAKRTLIIHGLRSDSGSLPLTYDTCLPSDAMDAARDARL